MLATLQAQRDRIVALCERHGVRRLDVFGSAARDVDFDPARSDVDLLVEFDPETEGQSRGPYFELRDELEQLPGRAVDLVEAGAIRNPYVRATIERDRRTLYAA